MSGRLVSIFGIAFAALVLGWSYYAIFAGLPVGAKGATPAQAPAAPANVIALHQSNINTTLNAAAPPAPSAPPPPTPSAPIEKSRVSYPAESWDFDFEKFRFPKDAQ